MSEKLSMEIQRYEKESAKLKAKQSRLAEQRKELVLNQRERPSWFRRLFRRQNDTVSVDGEIETVNTKITDIETVLLPHLQDELKMAKESESEKIRRQTVTTLLDEDQKLLNEGKIRIAQLIEAYESIKKNAQRINNIEARHHQIFVQVSQLHGVRPSDLDWVPFVVPEDFMKIANLAVREPKWLQQWQKEGKQNG